jgi:hypothetical protein
LNALCRHHKEFHVISGDGTPLHETHARPDWHAL